MALPELISQTRTSAYNKLYETLTGKPTPGSAEDKRRQIEEAQLTRRLQDELKPRPGETIEDIKRRGEILGRQLLDNQRSMMQLRLQEAGVGSLMEGRERLEQLGIQSRQADTKNEIDILDAKTAKQRALFGDLRAHEMDLAGGSEADQLQKVLGFYESAHDKNLAAQREANSFSNKIPGLLGGLLAAAAAFA